MNDPASIGDGPVRYDFSINPDTVAWTYKETIKAFDTLGGRVLQLLSVQVGEMTVTGQAGTREELQRFADSMAKIMRYHVNSGGRPVHFRVPSRSWDFTVYVYKVPSIGWNVKTVSYPWSLTLKVEEDMGIVTETILNAELDALAKEIGYSTDYHGGAGGTENLVAVIETLQNAQGGL